jgi:hypothetical protein
MGNPAAWSEPVYHHPRRRDPAGLSLILGTTRLINFAHDELVTLGATVAFLLNAFVMGYAGADYASGARQGRRSPSSRPARLRGQRP